jgi:hypothetical protein
MLYFQLKNTLQYGFLKVCVYYIALLDQFSLSEFKICKSVGLQEV